MFEMSEEQEPKKQKGKISLEELEKVFRDTASDKPRPDISNLVATKLAVAFCAARPIDGIRHTLEAVLAIPKENWGLAGLVADEMERISKMRAVCYPIINFRKVDDTTGSIAFPFDPNDADLYLSFFEGWDYLDQYPAEWKSAKSRNNRRYYLKLLALTLKEGADLSLCDTVANSFIHSATPFTYALSEKLFKKFISATEWEQAMAFVTGGGSHDAKR